MTRTTTSVLVSAALLAAGHTYGNAAQQRTPAAVTRIYTGQDGQTHAETLDVKLTPTSAERSVSDLVKTTGLRFVRLSPGVVQDWHVAPTSQYVVTISGQGEVEVAGGQKISLEPGRILLADDVTGKGHITRTVGAQDWIQIQIPVATQ